MRTIPPPTGTRLETIAMRARYRAMALRHRALRGGGELGPGAHIRISGASEFAVQPGFYARRDLTLIVAGKLSIGRGTACNRGVAIVALYDISIGDQVRFGERVSVLDHNHAAEPLDDLRARFSAYDVAPVRIGDRVLVGANSVILAGATIGDDAVIGAGSVVLGSIPAGTLAVGVPAVVKRALRPR